MVQQRSERAPSSLRLNQSESPTSGTRAPMTSPTSQPSSPRQTGVNGNSPLGAGSPEAHSTLNSSMSPGAGSGNSNADSRIPRPSPTALRRSASMRVRGERVQNIRTTGSLGPGSLSHHHNQHHYHRHNHISHQTEIFPAITENGLDSPRHRSLVSFILFNYLL